MPIFRLIPFCSNKENKKSEFEIKQIKTKKISLYDIIIQFDF